MVDINQSELQRDMISLVDEPDHPYCDLAGGQWQSYNDRRSGRDPSLRLDMQGTPDIAVTTTDGRRLALVEVKNLPKLSLGNATDLRDALVEQLPRPAMYVLVVSQDRGFMWRHQDQGAAYGEPEVLDMRPVLREYLSERELDRHIRGTDLELVVSHWLGELSRGRVMRPAGMSADGPFSQFVSDIRGAQVNLEALA